MGAANQAANQTDDPRSWNATGEFSTQENAYEQKAYRGKLPCSGRCFICGTPDESIFTVVCPSCFAEICPQCLANGRLSASACPNCGSREQDWTVKNMVLAATAYKGAKDWLSGKKRTSEVMSCCSAGSKHQPTRLITEPVSYGNTDSRASRGPARLGKLELRYECLKETAERLKSEVSGNLLNSISENGTVVDSSSSFAERTKPKLKPAPVPQHPALIALSWNEEPQELQDGGFKKSSVIRTTADDHAAHAKVAKGEALRLIEATRAYNVAKAMQHAEQALLLEAQIKDEVMREDLSAASATGSSQALILLKEMRRSSELDKQPASGHASRNAHETEYAPLSKQGAPQDTQQDKGHAVQDNTQNVLQMIRKSPAPTKSDNVESQNATTRTKASKNRATRFDTQQDTGHAAEDNMQNVLQQIRNAPAPTKSDNVESQSATTSRDAISNVRRTVVQPQPESRPSQLVEPCVRIGKEAALCARCFPMCASECVACMAGSPMEEVKDRRRSIDIISNAMGDR